MFMPPTHGKPATYAKGCRCDICQDGYRAWRRERHSIRREHFNAQQRESYARHRDRRREEKFIAAYGITWADRDALIEEQGGMCAICGSHESLELDHCHTSGVHRGMLCGRCNRAIGLMEDDPERLKRAANYLSA